MKTCTVCKSSEGKYKCPTCVIYYCSVTCYKTHIENNCILCETLPEEPKETLSKQMFETPDTISKEKLGLLRHNKDLKNLLSNPHLQHILKLIDTADNADEITQQAMLEPLFVEFADVCLKAIELPNR